METVSHSLETFYFQPFSFREGTCHTDSQSFVRVPRHVEGKPYLLSLQFAHQRTAIVSQKKGRLCCALPLPAVSTDNDSEGSASSSSTRQHNTKLWADNPKYESMLRRLQRCLETLNNVCQKAQMNKWMICGQEAWDGMQAWIKIPTAIFLPWFLFVSAFYGPSASMDLLPLWIIGPLMVGALVNSTVKMLASFHQWTGYKKLQETTLYVIDRARTGRLLEDAGAKVVKASLEMAEKMSTWVLYIRSGRFIIVLRQQMHRKLVQEWEGWDERFQDWRLIYLRWERTLKNIV